MNFNNLEKAYREGLAKSKAEAKEEPPYQYNMTMRQYYAAIAMQGLLSSGLVKYATATQVSQDAFLIADAMIAVEKSDE